MALGVVRMKRKAYEEPAEALVIALKKSKLDDEHCQVYLKLAATFPKEADFESGQIQAAISRDRQQKEQWRQSPKHIAFHSTVGKRIQYYKAEQKEKRLRALAGRRLILAQSPPQDSAIEVSNSEDSQKTSDSLFVLYDIIEENEDPKATSQVRESGADPLSTITCNGERLQRITGNGRTTDYVYDVYYIAKGNLDKQFIQGSLSIQPCEPAEELVLQDDEDEPEVYCDDDDDSNDEDNWRNDYPDEDSDFEKNYDYYDVDYEYEDTDYSMTKKFQKFNIDEDKESPAYAAYKARVLSDFDGGDEDEDDDI